MRYLFDTHIILWALAGDDKLPKEVRKIIDDSNNDIFYSTVSIWETEIKHLKISSFKLSGEQLAFLCDQNGLLNIQINNKHVYELKNEINNSNIEHNDSFDKLLLAQAISENMILITHDKKFKVYSSQNIMIV